MYKGINTALYTTVKPKHLSPPFYLRFFAPPVFFEGVLVEDPEAAGGPVVVAAAAALSEAVVVLVNTEGLPGL
jgi:hypothetical protein